MDLELFVRLFVLIGLLSKGFGQDVDNMYRCPDHLSKTIYLKTFKEKCYRFEENKMYWTSARDRCSREQGTLIQIRNQETQNWVVNTLNAFPWSTNFVWIGANDRDIEMDWRWVTGEQITWSYWASGQPNCDWLCVEDCGTLQRDNEGRWHDKPCSHVGYLYSFICQFDMKPATTTTITTTTPTTTTPTTTPTTTTPMTTTPTTTTPMTTTPTTTTPTTTTPTTTTPTTTTPTTTTPTTTTPTTTPTTTTPTTTTPTTMTPTTTTPTTTTPTTMTPTTMTPTTTTPTTTTPTTMTPTTTTPTTMTPTTTTPTTTTPTTTPTTTTPTTTTPTTTTTTTTIPTTTTTKPTTQNAPTTTTMELVTYNITVVDPVIPKDKHIQGALAGLVVACVLGALVLLVLISVWFFKSRKKEDKENNDMSYDNKAYTGILLPSTRISRHEQSLSNQVPTGSPSDYADVNECHTACNTIDCTELKGLYSEITDPKYDNAKSKLGPVDTAQYLDACESSNRVYDNASGDEMAGNRFAQAALM